MRAAFVLLLLLVTGAAKPTDAGSNPCQSFRAELGSQEKADTPLFGRDVLQAAVDRVLGEVGITNSSITLQLETTSDDRWTNIQRAKTHCRVKKRTIDDPRPGLDVDKSGIILESRIERVITLNLAMAKRLVRPDLGDRECFALLGLVAHEIGHLLIGHCEQDLKSLPLNDKPELERIRQEQEADFFAGAMLARLGAGKQDVSALIATVEMPELYGYPKLKERRELLLAGWRSVGRSNPDSLFKSFPLRLNRMDSTGRDIRAYGWMDLRTCAARCREIEDCQALNYDYKTRRCYLKSEIGKLYANTSATVLAKQRGEVSNPPPTELGSGGSPIRIWEIAYDHHRVADVAACRAKCESDGWRCAGFTYSLQQSSDEDLMVANTCYLFNRVDAYTPDENKRSGWRMTGRRPD